MCTKNTVQCIHIDNDGSYDALPECCRKHTTKTLFYIDRLFKENKIKYWLDYGTILGAVREKGIIVGDHDADISVFDKDRTKIYALKEKIIEDRFDMSLIGHRDLCRIHFSPVNRVFVDIWFWFRTLGRKRLMSSYHSSCPGNSCDFPEYYVKEFKDIPFTAPGLPTKMLNAPRNPKEFVKLRYGPHWRIPSNNSNVNWWSVYDYPKMYKW